MPASPLASASMGTDLNLVRIEPATSVIPANILRWYFHFNQSGRNLVRQCEFYLEELDGNPRRIQPFVDFGDELWSGDGTRLTIFFDPGRVKRHVKAADNRAAILRSGHHYRWLWNESTIGQFRAGAPIRTKLASHRWALYAPASPVAPVRVLFDRLMDPALLASTSSVSVVGGELVPGKLTISDGGFGWSFTPDQPWYNGDYLVNFAATLEDVCGNRVSESLDHLYASTTRRNAGCISMPFNTRKGRGSLSSITPDLQVLAP